ncbi:HD domain-containing protein [Clostridium felsineum]|uniref:Uncharacterized protein n=1 Tax=Clostridium felsineum TaxID=36839 RepID=A0A1S8L650_9CLOT|nr:HD domain-containing protein [Clostridium felsineum]URZ08708.1 hypothetical protein CLROS_041020 [Clostridium felsineum]URZ09336.1 hypothetical protein CROST_000070 [Clostridium felsineum]
MIDIVSDVIKEIILYFDGDVRRINHALKVYSFSKTIGELEKLPADDFKILEVAAILHDIGIKESEKKYNSSAGNYQELEGPPVAKKLLDKFNLNSSFVDRVCYLIGHHHTYTKIDGLDYQILVEADFIVNIFEDSMDKNAINSIKEKYFKTSTGIALIDSMYK